MSGSPRYAPSADVLVSQLQGEAVLLHLGTKSYYRLNRTGAEIWKLIAAGDDETAIVQSLVGTFEVTAAEATEEFRALVTDLRENRLLQEVD